MPEMKRFIQAGAVLAETLGDSYPELERRGWQVNGDPQIVSTPYGRGMSFDGTGDYLSDILVDLPADGSVSFWFKSTNASGNPRFFGFTKTDDTAGWNMTLSSTGTVTVDNAGGPTTALESSTSGFNDGQWHHVVGVRQDTNTYKIYVDGTLEANADTGTIPANYKLNIASYFNGSNAFPGDLVNFLVFQRALSDQEVSDLYNQTTFNYMDNLVSRWDMSEINPQDLTGSNNGTGTSITSSNIVVGQHGDAKAIDFDGSADYVTVTSSTTIENTETEGSVFCWFNQDTSTATNRALLSISDGSGWENGRMVLGTNGLSLRGRLGNGTVGPSGFSINGSASSFDVSQWNMSGLGWDGTTESLYINGAIDADDTQGTTDFGGNNLLIGDWTGVTNFDGKIGGIFLFNKKLTEIQARDLYEQTRQTSKSTSRINDPAYLKGYWPLNSHTDDVSGNGNDGTATSLTYTDGQFGRTVGDFNGSSSYITVPSITYESKLTITGWLNFDSILSSPGQMAIFGNKAIGDNTLGFVLYENYNGSVHTFQLKTSDGSASANISSSSVSLSANKQYFISATIDGSSSSIYLDGVNITSSVGPFGTFTGNTSDLVIGKNPTSSANYFNGQISNLRFYPNIALTGEEGEQIRRLEQFVPHMIPAQQPLSKLPDITDSSLVGAYLNSATDGTAKDYSNNNNDGTAVNVVLGNSQGVFPDGLSTSDGIKCGTDASLDLTNGTLAVTVNLDALDIGELIDKGISVAGAQNNYWLSIFSSTLYLGIGNGSNSQTIAYSTSNLTVNQSHRLAGTFDGSTLRLYVDGNEVHSGAQTITPGAVAGQLGVGARGWSGSVPGGIIKDVEIYNEAKDASWIASDYAKRVPDDDLKLWLKDSVTDKSRFNRSGTVVNVIEGNKLDFNGTDSVISTGSDWISTNDITLMGWINPDSFGEANEGRIFDNGKTIFFINSTLNRLRFTSDGGSTQSRADNAISTGQWQHVAVTRNGTMSTLYVNGVDVTDVGDSGTPASGSTVVFVGNNQAGSRTFDGKMDDVRGYNRILTASEIKTHYLQTRGGY